MNLAPFPWPHQSCTASGATSEWKTVPGATTKDNCDPSLSSIDISGMYGSVVITAAALQPAAAQLRDADPLLLTASRCYIHDAAAHCLRRTLYAYCPL